MPPARTRSGSRPPTPTAALRAPRRAAAPIATTRRPPRPPSRSAGPRAPASVIVPTRIVPSSNRAGASPTTETNAPTVLSRCHPVAPRNPATCPGASTPPITTHMSTPAAASTPATTVPRRPARRHSSGSSTIGHTLNRSAAAKSPPAAVRRSDRASQMLVRTSTTATMSSRKSMKTWSGSARARYHRPATSPASDRTSRNASTSPTMEIDRDPDGGVVQRGVQDQADQRRFERHVLDRHVPVWHPVRAGHLDEARHVVGQRVRRVEREDGEPDQYVRSEQEHTHPVEGPRAAGGCRRVHVGTVRPASVRLGTRLTAAKRKC